MLFKLTEFPGNDFDLYFRGCLIRFTDPEGKDKWVVYDGFSPDDQAHLFRVGKERSTTFKVDKTQIKKCKVESRFPVGYFNTKESVVYCARDGKRQNQKGLSAGHNFEIVGMETIVMGSIDFQTDDQFRASVMLARESKLTPELAASFDQPKYLPLKEALVSVRSRKAFARALSPEFAVTPHHINKDYLLFFHRMPVAEIVSKESKVKVLVEDYRQELTELLEPQGATILS